MVCLEVLSRKLVIRRRNWDAHGGWHEHWCPGCEEIHRIAVEKPFRNGARWTWNGCAQWPTFEPSVHVGPNTPLVCHYFIRKGQIEFCSDSHHALAGQTVPLPDFPLHAWSELASP